MQVRQHRTRRRLQLALVAWCVSATVGCQLWRREQINYQTIAADSQHDTDLARTEHAKALKFMVGKRTNLDKADLHLQRALVADVTYGPAHNSLGMLYFGRRAMYLAAWEFEYAAKLMPDRIEPLYNLGLVFETAGNYDRAMSFYEQAMCLESNDARLIGAMARVLRRKGAPVDEIRPLLEKMVLVDTRPDWVSWARNELGLHPIELEQDSTSFGEAPEPISTPAPVSEPVDNLELPAEGDPGAELLPVPEPLGVKNSGESINSSELTLQ